MKTKITDDEYREKISVSKPARGVETGVAAEKTHGKLLELKRG